MSTFTSISSMIRKRGSTLRWALFAVGGLLVVADAGLALAKGTLLSAPALDLERNLDGFTVRANSAGNYDIEYMVDGKLVHASYEPPIKLSVRVDSRVEYDPLSGSYSFHYQLANDAGSDQKLHAFTIDHSGAVFDVQGPDGWLMIQVAFRPALTWGDVAHFGIEPGKQQNGFSFQTRQQSNAQKFRESSSQAEGLFFQASSLPGIVACYALGHTPTMGFPTDVPAEWDEVAPRRFEAHLRGSCIGPVAFDRYDKAALIDRLISDIGVASEQKWIKTVELRAQYVEQFRRAKDALKTGDAAKYFSSMRRTRAESDADLESGGLLPEAHAIVYHGARYLVGNFH